MEARKNGFTHWIFTRFNRLDDNITIYNNPQIKDADEWMDHRCKLFNEITLPSVMCQTETNFKWLLSFAEETPKPITDFYASFPHVKIIYEYPRTWLRKQPFKDGEWIATGRLDNDDHISPTFIEQVQSRFDEKTMLVDTGGRKLDLATNKLYTVERNTCNSPFITLLEQFNTPHESISHDPIERELFRKNTDGMKLFTVYYCSHSKLEWHFPAVKINEPLYKMVLHDRNIINKLGGNEHEIL